MKIFKKSTKQKELLAKIAELEWAHIFHDSIKGTDLDKLSINVGRWAGNYSFFYVLYRILKDYKPERILDLGLGESSKFISTFIQNYAPTTVHTVVEQDSQWITFLKQNFCFGNTTQIVHCPIEIKKINGFEVTSYQGFTTKITPNYNLFIVDGPFGSDRYSRYDIVPFFKEIATDKQFIILFDDCDRKAEKETAEELIQILRNRNISIHTTRYSGAKTQIIIATDSYKYATSF